MKKIGLLLLCVISLSLVGCQKERMLDVFVGTPHIYVIQEGKVAASVGPTDHPTYFESKKDLNSLLKDHDLVNEKQKVGQKIEVSYEQYKKMVDNKETFIVLVSQTNCGHCNQFKEDVLNDYIAKNGVKFYEINIANETEPKTVFESFEALIKE